jgi:hypothetical protein
VVFGLYHVVHTHSFSRLYEVLGSSLGLQDENAMLEVIIAKIITNLKVVSTGGVNLTPV